jgi:prepilin-type N-terminal cleavage/methylation domain-containing protein
MQVILKKENEMSGKKGFTLVELLIVVLIIGALAAIAIPRISSSASTAKINACKTNIDVINTQIELYNANTGSWPATLDVVTQNTTYFPDGEPVCPVDDTAYANILVNNRVDTTGHTH